MKQQLNIDSDHDNEWLSDAIDAATEAAEELLSASLLNRNIVATITTLMPVYLVSFDNHHYHRIALPRGPVQSIASIVDANGAITKFTLEREGCGDFVRIDQHFTGPLVITYVAGYGSTTTSIPSDIRMAIRTHVASLWRNRESISDLKLAPTPHSLEMFYMNKRRSVPVA